MSNLVESDRAFVRLFVAAGLDDDLRAELARTQERLRRIGARVGWVKPANLHVTLVFLGNQPAGQLTELSAVLDEAVADMSPFESTVAGLGWFGSARSPRVIWAGLRGAEELWRALHRRIVDALATRGIEAGEERPYRAHVTLGRVRPGGRAALGALTEALGSANNTQYGRIFVDRIFLMESRLQPQGVTYVQRHEARMKGIQHHG